MIKKIHFLLTFLIVIFCALSYFPIETFAEETKATQKSDDVVVVSNPKTPELDMRIVFTEELSIGEVEGDENYMFGQNNVKYPKYKPAYQGLTLMENGWLAVIVDSVEDEYTLFDLFDEEGKYIAHFKTPIPAEGMLAGFLFFKNGRAYSVVTEDDYKFVKRYRIEIQEFKDNKWVRKK